MATNVLNIGRSALNAAQIGLGVTGHNIANASTPGYSRQEIVQSAALAQNFGFGFIGQGTEVSQIRRNYSAFLTQQFNSAQSASSANNAYATQMTQIDNMLADPSAGLSPSFQQFFSSMQALSSNPGDGATRQATLSSAQSLVNRFADIGNRLEQLRSGVNAQLSSLTEQATSYATQIAQLNDSISKSLAVSETNPPNDLMDRRDFLVLKLNELVKTDVQKQGDGSYNVFIGNGIPLVVGNKANGLTVVGAGTDPSRLEVAYVSGSTATTLGENSIVGGEMGGLLQFRSASLDPIQNQLGQIATVFAATFNAQHQSGYDAAGVAGAAFFNVPSPTVFGHANNSVSAALTTNISDATALTGNDYRIAYDGSNYNITNLSDNTVQSFASLPQTLDGLTINGTLASGDSFLIQPTRNGATAISLAITDTAKIAAADATGGNGNNLNALLLADLQNQGTLNNSSVSYESAFAQLVSTVGNKTNELKVASAAAEALLMQTEAAQQSESGVNLDEEAANLLRYQQAYQAAGKVMQIASSLFDTLLTIGR
ncbi:MAG: flagellar hook-associated protein FlgK [Methylophilaceae bacterium]